MKKLLITTAIISALSSPCIASEMKYPLNSTGLGQVIERQPIVSGDSEATFDRLITMWQEMQEKYTYIDDATNYGKWWDLKGKSFEYWATPDEFYKNGGGDCEDWAIAAYYKLRESGFAAEQLTIAVGYLPKRNNENHVVLFVELKGFEFVLDQLRPTVALSDLYTEETFQPHYFVNENGWRINK